MKTLLRIFTVCFLLLPLIQAEEKVQDKKQEIITLPIAKSVPRLDSLRSSVSKALGDSIDSGPSSALYYTGDYFLAVGYRMPKVTHLVYMRAANSIQFAKAHKERDREKMVLVKIEVKEIKKLLSRHAADSTGAKLIWTSIGDNHWQRSDGSLAKYEVEKKILMIATEKQAKKIVGF